MLAPIQAAASDGNTLSRPARLRAMLGSGQTEFLMEAHNGLSARIVEEAGFRGIWASGLALAAQYGVRDNNEASWTQILDMVEFMADASALPILVDGDTGYGNFNNVRRLVRKLEQIGVAGVCIEDKQFPKTNSFLDSERQPLADIDEFSGKIKAAKDTQSDPDFNVVARVEALIAGWSMEEALRRAETYRQAGADAILIHSKLSRPDEIVTFAREWANRLPLVIVPTKYYSTPTEVFREAGISLVIWANHLIRAATAAMQSVGREIHEAQTLVNVEDGIASVGELFRLQGADEYARAERVYMSAGQAAPAAIVLAASRGEGLEALTEERPKVMLPVAGKPLLRWLVDAFKNERINDITVVAGYKAQSVDSAGVRVLVNPDYAATGELASLACAADRLTGDTVITYGDLLFRSYILRDLLEVEAPLCIVVDSAQTGPVNASAQDFAWCSAADERGVFGQHVMLRRIVARPGAAEAAPHGRWIGMLNARGEGVEALRACLALLRARPDFAQLGMPDLLNTLVEAGHAVRVLYVHGHWRGVNDLEDFRLAGDFAHAPAARAARDDERS